MFTCPRCGKEAIRVELLRDEQRAVLRCGSCGLKNELPTKMAYGEVDVYSQFMDRWYSGKVDVTAASESKSGPA